MNDAIQFLLDGDVFSVHDVDPTRTVLQFLREDVRRLGTKEGCAEGDCGACTVVVAELDSIPGTVRYQAINSCIKFLPTLHGKALLTVESLDTRDGELHPVQQALVDQHGSQCGFCTPGIVMSLFALYQQRQFPSLSDVDIALSGNLCRCTGYRPIVDAAMAMHQSDSDSAASRQKKEHAQSSVNPVKSTVGDDAEIISALRKLPGNKSVHVKNSEGEYYAPTTLAEFAGFYKQHPEACLLAGGTDIGLWVTKQHRQLRTLLYAGQVAELLTTQVTSSHLEIGAAVTLSDVMPVLTAHYPQLQDLFNRFASPPIRNAGTLGGNIANGSPIGDSMPVLMAIGTSIVLRAGDVTRELLLDEYYLDYMKTAAKPGEFIERVRIPLPVATQIVRTYKVSKRFDQDISAVCGAFAVLIEAGRVAQVQIAYGGMAAIPKRARACEAVLHGQLWNDETLDRAMRALDEDYSPLSDMRASAEYRQQCSRNLLRRFYLESTGYKGATDVYQYAR